jgi:hypothetical protein
MKTFVAVLAVSFLFTSSVSGQNWTKAFVRNRVPNASHGIHLCTVAVNQGEMESDLRDAGWPLATFKPVVDWESDFAVIIAPREWDPIFDLAFSNVKWDGSMYVLYWGWWSAKQQQWRAERKQWRGSSSITIGQGTPKYQVLVVAVKRHVYGQFKCQEIDSRRSYWWR